MSANYLNKTPILDIDAPEIQTLINERAWKSLDTFNKIGAAYTFVKDEILFGYNRSDDIAASVVLTDGYGQCNTKGNLLMALLRALNIPCRFHGFTIDQQLQRGAIPDYIFWLAPKYILHSWVEVYFDGKWISLEGFILDSAYLKAIQHRFPASNRLFCGYGIATTCFEKPETDWKGEDTFIQKEGIHDDFGLFDSPDEFYKQKGTNLSGIRRWLYQSVIRHLINLNVKRLRNDNEHVTRANA